MWDYKSQHALGRLQVVDGGWELQIPAFPGDARVVARGGLRVPACFGPAKMAATRSGTTNPILLLGTQHGRHSPIPACTCVPQDGGPRGGGHLFPRGGGHVVGVVSPPPTVLLQCPEPARDWLEPLGPAFRTLSGAGPVRLLPPGAGPGPGWAGAPAGPGTFVHLRIQVRAGPGLGGVFGGPNPPPPVTFGTPLSPPRAWWSRGPPGPSSAPA